MPNAKNGAGLARVLQEIKTLSDKEGGLIRGAPEHTTKDKFDEFVRRITKEQAFYVRSLKLADRLWTVLIFVDIGRRDAFSAQMTPFSLTQPRLTNLLLNHSNSRMGTFSIMKNDVPTGQLVALEFPIIVMPSIWLNPKTGETSTTIDFNTMLQNAVGMLAPERRSAYSSLYNAWRGHTDPRGQGEYAGIYNTNALGVELPGDEIIKFSGVFDAISRINHSCSPNATWIWDVRSCTMAVRVISPVARGEEVTISYVTTDALLKPASARRAELYEGYRFKCACSVCGGSQAEVAASDARRAELARTPIPRRRLFLAWLHGSGADSLLIDKSLRACELYERERLLEPDHDHELWTHSTQLMYCYLALGMERKARVWAYKVLVRALVVEQDRSSSIVVEAERTVMNPMRSPMWGARNKLQRGAKSDILRDT